MNRTRVEQSVTRQGEHRGATVSARAEGAFFYQMWVVESLGEWYREPQCSRSSTVRLDI